MEFFFTVLGMVLILEGIPWFLSPAGMKRVLRQILTMSDSSLRLLGLVLMVSGLLFVYLAAGGRG